MLELNEDQMRQLAVYEHDSFATRVRDALVEEFPDLATPELLPRLKLAHARALALGIESAAARTQFLYQEAFAPGFDQQPAIKAWLTKPGASAEQRWRDFLALASAQIAER